MREKTRAPISVYFVLFNLYGITQLRILLKIINMIKLKEYLVSEIINK